MSEVNWYEEAARVPGAHAGAPQPLRAAPQILLAWEQDNEIYAGRYALPYAAFSAEPLSGSVPLTVTFTNLSTPTQIITGAVWHYGDGVTGDSLALTHTHVYTGAGVYTVTLSVGDGVITDTLTRTHYITVTGGTSYTTTTRVITYTYDHLYRLTDADYSTGESFEYGYDAVGNRQALTETLGGSQTVHAYQYGCISMSRGRTLKFGGARG
jgi:PKD repeat protein